MDIVNLISSVGFPIVACCAMGYFCKYLIDTTQKEMRETIERNTEAINELCQRLGVKENDKN